MGLVLPHTGIAADGTEYTKAWVLNWDKVAQASWISIPPIVPVKIVFDMRAILPVLIMFIVTAVETVGDISGVVEGGMDREATDKELSGGVILRWTWFQYCGAVRCSSETLRSARTSGLVTIDKGSQPHGTCNRRGIPDSVRSDSEAGCDRFDHAAVGTGRRSGYDVLFDRS